MPAARILLALLFAFAFWIVSVSTAQAQGDPETTCSTVPTVSPGECEALVALFIATDGAQWINRSNWLQKSADWPCDWYGVTCSTGTDRHVIALELEGNRLRGRLPRNLNRLTHLQTLLLADNLLRGDAPPTICELTDTVTQASLDYNQLTAPNGFVRQCLLMLDADGANTQTVPPRNLRVTAITTNSIELAWEPILYTGDGGGYEIGISQVMTGPFTSHGMTADKSANSYLIDGLTPGERYFIRIRTITPVHANQSFTQTSTFSELAAVTAAETDPTLLIVYFPGDNDLSPYISGVVRRIQIGTRLNPNVYAIFLGDGYGEHNTRVVEISGGVVMTTTAVMDEWGKDELDTTDPAVLAWFLRYARNRVPSSRTVVSLMGHGMGFMPEFNWLVEQEPGEEPVPQPGIPPLPKGVEATPGDVADAGGYMSTRDFYNALAAATDNWTNPFDLIFFDQCFQGNIDVLYEVHRAAEVIIASPNYAWLSAPYHQYLTVLTPSATADEMADSITAIYESSLNENHPNAILWVRGEHVPTIAAAVGDLCDALLNALAAGRNQTIITAAQSSQYVDTTQCSRQNFQLGPPDELLGAASFARNLQTGFGIGDSFGVYNAADALLKALTNVHTRAITGSPYLAPDEVWDYEDSLTLLAPLRRGAPSNVAWRSSVYTTTVPMTAIWSPAPSQSLLITETFALARDERWDDFLAAWYGEQIPTIGEWCQYIPPVLTTSEVTETLTLELEPQEEHLQLQWTETTSPDAVEYWILARGDRYINWVLLASVPLSQTVYLASLPDPGETAEYRITAQDAQGITLAESNNVTHTSPHVIGSFNLWLPSVKP